MVQILQSHPKEKNKFSSMLGLTLGQSLGQGASEGYQEARNQSKLSKQMAQENEQIKRNFGLDLTGVVDPKQRQMVVQAALQGANQQQLEMLKQQGKKDLLGEKQGFLGKLFGDGRQEDQKMAAQQEGGQALSSNQQQGQQQFDPSKLTPQQIAEASALDPNLGRALGHLNDVALREKRESEKFEFEKKKNSPENKREQTVEAAQANADVKYNQSLQEAYKQHGLKKEALDRLQKLNEKGVTGKPYEKLLEKAGLINLTSEGRREFAADVKTLITDIRSILGGQFSTFEFQTILNAYPSADFSQEANKAIINNLQAFEDIRDKEFEFAAKLKKENKGKTPYDFQSRVNEMVRQYADSKVQDIKKNTREILNAQYGIPKGQTLLIAPDGEPMGVPDDQVNELIGLGAQLP